MPATRPRDHCAGPDCGAVVQHMPTDDIPDLSEQQTTLLTALPAHISELADSLGVQRSTVRDHIERVRQKGIDIEYDRDAEQWYNADERAPELQRLSSKHKSQITREANELIEAEESLLLRRLEQSEPLSHNQPPRDQSESFVVVFGDTHFGDVVETERGDTVYDMDIAERSVDLFAENVLQMHDLESATQNFHDCHLVLTGDIATGTHIYDGQVHDIEAYLAEQVTRSSQKLIDLIVTLADRFETVDVYAVLGNHGLDRASAARGSNTDLITYRWVQDGLRRMQVENVEMTVADGSHTLTTRIRDHTLHIRHGQQTQEHVDATARSESDWRGYWADVNNPPGPNETVGFDVAVRGHHHQPSLDFLLNTYPVFTAPSPKPGGEFADSIGKPDVGSVRYLGWCFGTGDSRRLTFKRVVDDQ